MPARIAVLYPSGELILHMLTWSHCNGIMEIKAVLEALEKFFKHKTSLVFSWGHLVSFENRITR